MNSFVRDALSAPALPWLLGGMGLAVVYVFRAEIQNHFFRLILLGFLGFCLVFGASIYASFPDPVVALWAVVLAPLMVVDGFDAAVVGATRNENVQSILFLVEFVLGVVAVFALLRWLSRRGLWLRPRGDDDNI